MDIMLSISPAVVARKLREEVELNQQSLFSQEE
jgi:hypothetical protein